MSFFVFSLCLLAMPKPPKERLVIIVSHGIYRAGGGGEADKIGLDRIAGYVKQCQKGDRCLDYDPHSEDHNRLVRGAIVCNVTIGSFSHCLNNRDEAQKFIDAHERTYGRSPLVFVGAELFWGCYGRDNPNFRQFSVLCAVNSIIGKKATPVLIRRQLLYARQLGYNTPAEMKAALRRDQETLTEKKLRNALIELETRGLICRFQASRRNVYFSTRLLPDELAEAVKQILRNKFKIQNRREMDRQAMADLKHEAEERGPLKNRGHLKRSEPEQDQSAATQRPQEGPLKEQPSNNSDLNKSIQITADDLV